MFDNNHKGLLPSGFSDSLPPESEQESRAVARLMKMFSGYGYSRIKPPLFEFEEGYFAAGPGAAMIRDTFRTLDPLSHRMMALRSDITPQIVRIACSLLAEEARPLRLTYANDVLRVHGGEQRTQRQFCQVGCEIIGSVEEAADVEAIVLCALAMEELDIKGVTIDLACPSLLRALIAEHELPADTAEAVLNALVRRASDQIESLDIPKSLKGVLSTLITAAGGNVEALQGLKLSGDAAGQLTALLDVYEQAKGALEALGLSELVLLALDPTEMRGFDYHTGVAFTVFADAARGELGRGGRYEASYDGHKAEEACGFTLYMDTLRAVMPDMEGKKRLQVPQDLAWPEVKALKDEGWIVVRALSGEQDGDMGCTHVWQGGKIVEFSKSKKG